MSIRKTVPLILAALILGAALTACQEQEEVIYEIEVRAQNNGQPATLTVETQGLDAAYLQELEHIIEKYQADFPNTDILFEGSSLDQTEKNLLFQAAGTASKADLQLVRASGQGGAQELADLSEYLDFWQCEGSLGAWTSLAMHHMGAGPVFAVPADLKQNMLFYRKDWFGQFNEDKRFPADQALLETWGQLLDAHQKLGGQGGLALSREQAGDCFNTLLWSALGRGSLADAAAAYYSAKEEEATVFSAEKARDVAGVFGKLYAAALDGGELTQEQAVEAFLNGEAGILIADASAEARLAEALPEEAWAGRGLPQTDNGQSLVPCKWWGWGVSASSEELEKAIHFLCYLTNADNNTHLAATCGVMPLYKEALMMEPELAYSTRGVELEQLREGNIRYMSEPIMYKSHQGFEERLVQRLEDFLDQKLSAEELLVGLDDYWSEARQSQGSLWVWEEDE